jgi:hypothetical protein
MSTETTTLPTGGFLGDPAEALNAPTSAGGCCGSPVTTGTVQITSQASTCCGTVPEAEESCGCCGETAKVEADASSAGCCG